MPMAVRNGENQAAFMHRCISETVKSGRPQDQAVAICAQYWNKGKIKKEDDPNWLSVDKEKESLFSY
jgi:hypothetical protein